MSGMYWKNCNVFVTGAYGLLGPWLVEELIEQGAHVVVLMRDSDHRSLFFRKKLQEKTICVSGDLVDFSCLLRVLNEYNIDTLFHLGAQPIVGVANRSPISTFKSNIEGTWNILEACRLSRWVRKIIVASSDKAYGSAQQLPYDETMPLQGKHPYDVSKSCSDLLAQSYFHTYKVPVCITRCGNFFGGGDIHFNRIIPGTMRSIIHNERPTIRSNGLLLRDYIYVKDVVDAYLTLAQHMDDEKIWGEAFNFSTDKPYTVLEIVEEVLKVSGRLDLQPLVMHQASNEIEAQHLCSQKARTMLGWQPRYGVKEGLEETYRWYRSAMVS